MDIWPLLGGAASGVADYGTTGILMYAEFSDKHTLDTISKYMATIAEQQQKAFALLETVQVSSEDVAKTNGLEELFEFQTRWRDQVLYAYGQSNAPDLVLAISSMEGFEDNGTMAQSFETVEAHNSNELATELATHARDSVIYNEHTAPMLQPGGMTADNAGRLYFADGFTQRVNRINDIWSPERSPSELIEVIAGTGYPAFDGNDKYTSSNTVTLNQPSDVLSSADGSLLIADGGNHQARNVTGLVDRQECPYSSSWAQLLTNPSEANKTDVANAINCRILEFRSMILKALANCLRCSNQTIEDDKCDPQDRALRCAEEFPDRIQKFPDNSSYYGLTQLLIGYGVSIPECPTFTVYQDYVDTETYIGDFKVGQIGVDAVCKVNIDSADSVETKMKTLPCNTNYLKASFVTQVYNAWSILQGWRMEMGDDGQLTSYALWSALSLSGGGDPVSIGAYDYNYNYYYYFTSDLKSSFDQVMGSASTGILTDPLRRLKRMVCVGSATPLPATVLPATTLSKQMLAQIIFGVWWLSVQYQCDLGGSKSKRLGALYYNKLNSIPIRLMEPIYNYETSVATASNCHFGCGALQPGMLNMPLFSGLSNIPTDPHLLSPTCCGSAGYRCGVDEGYCNFDSDCASHLSCGKGACSWANGNCCVAETLVSVRYAFTENSRRMAGLLGWTNMVNKSYEQYFSDGDTHAGEGH